MTWLEAVGSALGGGGLASAATLLVGRKRITAEAGRIDADAAVTLIKGWEGLLAPLQAEVVRLAPLQAEVAQLRAAHILCEAKNAQLEARVCELEAKDRARDKGS